MEDVLSFKWKKGVKEVYPSHPMVQNWLFTKDTEDEAMLAHQMAVVAEKNGITANDLQHLFPAVLRMLKSNSAWSGVSRKPSNDLLPEMLEMLKKAAEFISLKEPPCEKFLTNDIRYLIKQATEI